MTSHGMDYVLNEHLDFMPTWHICNIISDNIVIQLIWKFQESNWNPDWFIALMDSFDTNYIFTNNKKSWPIWPKCNTIPDNAMLQLSWKFGWSKWYPYWVNMLASHLGLIMSLMSMKMLANMVHMWYSLRWCHVTGILQVCLINLNSSLTHCVNELIWKWLCP